MKIKINEIIPINLDISSKGDLFKEYLLENIEIVFTVHTNNSELSGKVKVPGSLLTPIIESAVEKIKEQIKEIN